MNEVNVDTEAVNVVQHDVHFVGAGPGDPELITVKGATAVKRGRG